MFKGVVGIAGWLKTSKEKAHGDSDDDLFLLDKDPEVRQDRVDGLLQQYSVVLEFERLQDLMPSGMYVMPSFENPLSWHGTLFAKKGLYRGGVFKFILEMPPEYPDQAPELRFVTEVFHAMIDPATGRFDMRAVFPEWRPGKDFAACCLPHVRKAFLRREYLGGTVGKGKPLNEEAAELFKNDPGAFGERAAECASRSIDKVYDGNAGSSLCFSKGPADAHQLILDQLRKSDKSQSVEDQTIDFVDWFCDHYANQRTCVGVAHDAVETVHFDVVKAESSNEEEGDEEEDEEIDPPPKKGFKPPMREKVVKEYEPLKG